ncbi:hypothetical protein ACI65C_003879 [Semiaphis heraclei]
MQPVRYLARNSRSLLQNVDSNVVESLNGIIAKLIGGKRINFAMSRSYQGRVAAATVMKNTKRPMYKLHKTLLEHSPGKKWPSSKLEIQRQRKQLRQNELRSKTYRTKLKFQCDYVDPSYGEKSQKPDMTSEQFDDEKKNIINLLKEMAANCDVIEKETVEQSASSKWLEYRRHLITASNFGRIICLRADTGCENVVKKFRWYLVKQQQKTFGDRTIKGSDFDVLNQHIDVIKTKSHCSFFQCINIVEASAANNYGHWNFRSEKRLHNARHQQLPDNDGLDLMMNARLTDFY